MLEQQQERLVSALQEMYHRACRGELWPGPKLLETNGQPLTHDILAGFGVLEMKHEGSGETEHFEEDFENLQSRLIGEGAGYNSHHSQGKSTAHSTPSMVKQPGLNNKQPKSKRSRRNERMDDA